jgi:hypothetical protein
MCCFGLLKHIFLAFSFLEKDHPPCFFKISFRHCKKTTTPLGHGMTPVDRVLLGSVVPFVMP